MTCALRRCGEDSYSPNSEDMLPTMDQPKSQAPTEREILEFQERCEAFYPQDAVNATVEMQRQWYDALCLEFSPPLPDGLTKTDMMTGGVSTRLYRPSHCKTDVLLVYFHGGGFVVGSLESHDSICAEIAEATGAELIATDYRLAPEHQFPAQADDCFAVFSARLEEGRPLIVMGDSAGANLAAGLVIRAKEAGLTQAIIGQVLIYPALGGDLTKGSYVEMAQAPGLTTADVAYYRDILGAPESNSVAHPLQAQDVSSLPATYISAAHFDPLRDDARNYAARLAMAGVNVTFREEPQMVHAWLRARHMSPGASAGFKALCEATRQMIKRAGG